MTHFNQQGQNVSGDQLNAETINVNADTINIIEPELKRCYICGKLCRPEDTYECKRCRNIACLSHKVDASSPYSPKCKVLVDVENSLFSSTDEVRRVAAQNIWSAKDQSTMPALMKRIKVETDSITKHWLYSALARLGGEEAQKILREAQNREGDAFVLQGIEDGLQSITTEAHFDK
ncbi:MAG: HEAT repeat domain-containing protein [Anaerolineales bacterium]|nr:HEAT repeat domain-containing protein [Anaerolineales bacterium]